MKLSGREAARFCKAPDLGLIGALIHGADAGQISAARQALVLAVMGEELDDMRLTKLDGAEARRDAAMIDGALRARGFFPGRQVVVIERGTDGLGKPLDEALTDITPEDAFLIVTADALTARSALRKLFESRKSLISLQLFQTPPGPQDVKELLAKNGFQADVQDDALRYLTDLGAEMNHGSFVQLIAMIALFSANKSDSLTFSDVCALAPSSVEAELDAIVEAIAGGRPESVVPLLRRMAESGLTPVTLLIALQRYFRQLLMAAIAPGGAETGIASLRPPVWGPRRQAMSAQLRRWRPAQLEQAVRMLFEADAHIRSAGQAPNMAIVERYALRLAMMGRG